MTARHLRPRPSRTPHLRTPYLRTLGCLELIGHAFGREKPLLLLAYLALRGEQPRRDVAQLFWPSAANPMNSLSVAVAQLRKTSPTLIVATESRVSTLLACDAAQLQTALHALDLAAAADLYGGPFLLGLGHAELSGELEEWVLETREALADAYRHALLTHARTQARTQGADDVQAAAHTAATAYALVGATPLAPEQLRELHALLGGAAHPDAARVAQEAQGLGLKLSLPEPGAAPLLGRRHELERLRGLAAGEVLWLRALRGLGKSALLRAAALGGGTLLVGQSGQPYQTLSPLAPDSAPTTDEGWLKLLIASKDALLLDDWEAADPESRRVLLRLAQSRAGGPLVFSSRERSPLGSGSGLSELPLRPLPPEALSAGEYAQTGGLPALVAALHAQESLSDTLATLLSPLSPQVRQVLACLALQDQPAPQVTRRALELDPEALAGAQETLGLAGLWQSGTGQGNIVQGGAVAARPTVLAWLAAQPSLEAEVLILLAPQVPPAQALPLYLRAQALTGSSTLPGFQAALAVSALALLDAEQESEAEELLAAHARTPETWLLHARALDTLGRGPEALKRLEDLPLTPDVQAVRSLALWRTGHTEEARHAAQEALSGDLPARARGHMVLGNLALSARDYKQAKAAFSRACGLFQLLVDELNYLKALCQQAVAMTGLNDDLDVTMREIRLLSAQHPQAQTLSNIGWLLERQSEPAQALDFYRQAAELAQTKKHSAAAAMAWNNVGTVEQQLGRMEFAEQAYQTAMTHARLTGDIRTLAVVLGNLAELKESLPLIEEALELLRDAGQADLVAYFEEQRTAFMARSGGN